MDSADGVKSAGIGDEEADVARLEGFGEGKGKDRCSGIGALAIL